MEFWGVEVKAGEPLKVTPGAGRVIHISQAALGEGKKEKANDLVPLRLKINGQKFVVGSLSGEKFPQVTFDLVFEKEFELSHDWKNGSVYFCGYSAENPFEDEEDGFDSESDDDEDIPTLIAENGTIEAKVEVPIAAATKAKAAKPESSAKPKVTVVEPQKDDESDEDDESDDDEDESDDDEDMKDVLDSISDSDDEDDSEDEDEETPKKEKAGPSKKRATESATKTPVPAKKAKLDTPQKTDGKKGGGHTATPHPSKKAGKSPAANNSNKSKEQTPKSEGKVTCKSCSRTFNSDKALESHSKAKHASN